MSDRINRSTYDSIQKLVKEDSSISNAEIGRLLGIGKTTAGKWRKAAYPGSSAGKGTPMIVGKILGYLGYGEGVQEKKVQRKSTRIGKVIAVIPDCQVKPGVPIDHLRHIGNYLAEKKPDYVVNIGDFADMPSLNSYTIGKAEAEGNRYTDDIKSVHTAMEALMAPILDTPNYNPQLHLTLGNHEHRITREAESNPKFTGVISVKDLQYEQWGWKVHPFLKVVTICGVEFCHYFVSGSMGRPVSSAAALLRTRQSSAIMGHAQFTDISFHPKTGNVAIFVGICYQHSEKYLTPQGNNDRKQIVMLNEVENGTFDPMFVSLRFLRKRYS